MDAPEKPKFFKKFKTLKINRVFLNSIFILALLILILININAYEEVKSLFQANKMVIHTHEVISSIDNSLYLLSDLESDQRGYLLTNDVNYLREVNETRQKLSENLTLLAQLTQDNPPQYKKSKQFSELIEGRLKLLNEIARFKHEGLHTQAGITLLNQSNEASNRVKSLGQELKIVESVLLKERNWALIHETKTTMNFIIIGSTASIILLIFPFILANLELSNRQVLENKSRRISTHLNQIIESTSEMIAALDTKNRFRIFNEAYKREFKRLFGNTLIPGITLEEALPQDPSAQNELIDKWKASFDPNLKTQTIQVERNGMNTIYEVHATQIFNEQKEISGIVHSIRNITDRLEEHLALKQAYKKLSLGMNELKNKNTQITLLVDMSDILLASTSQKELSDVMAQFAQKLLCFASGYLYIMHPSKNHLEQTGQWGTPLKQETIFGPEHCWGIRLGRTYQASARGQELICGHINNETSNVTTICVPLMAQNDIYGLLYFEISKKNFVLSEDQRLVVSAFAELTALSLANIRLRENLRFLSIRDPLTGLYNRRFLDEMLSKQFHQAQRDNTTFTILMIDLDHFKKINDTFGHEAGDAVLKQVGEIFQNNIRAGDVSARYGGEEFVIMLHNISLDNAKKSADLIRVNVSNVQIQYGAQQIAPITISIGIAMYPLDGTQIEEIMEKADRALYLAKKEGRNRVVAYSDNLEKV
jgi:diguanylate cyclase (GGDEF)-like protein/PAS domain S-box-containing protein